MSQHGAVAADDGGEPSSLGGRTLVLRPVRVDDYGDLYDMLLSDDIVFRWRSRGSTPRPEDFADTLWHGVLAQFVAEDRRTGRLVGMVTCYNANLNSYAYLAVVAHPQFVGTGRMFEAVALFITYLFRTFNFRKLYGESLAFNYVRFASGNGRYWIEEGRLRDHEWHGGRYWDFVTIALYRETWERASPRLLRHFGARS